MKFPFACLDDVLMFFYSMYCTIAEHCSISMMCWYLIIIHKSISCYPIKICFSIIHVSRQTIKVAQEFREAFVGVCFPFMGVA